MIDALANNWKATLIGVGITLGGLWAFAQSFGITNAELTRFVLDHKKERDTVAEQLRAINAKVDRAESASHKNYTTVLTIIQDPQDAKQNYDKIVQMSAENQDIIRAFLEFGRIYASLVKLGQHTEQTHEHLGSLYQALLDITADDPLAPKEFNSTSIRNGLQDQGKSLCNIYRNEPICKAKDRLIAVERSISDFPSSVRDDVEIEVLRYLSYCLVRAEARNQQQLFTRRAEKIYAKVEEESGVDGKLYRRKYYWIDYSNLVASVSKGAPGYEAESWRHFNRLRGNLATEQDFLLQKLLQHKNLITEPDKVILWESFIRRARP